MSIKLMSLVWDNGPNDATQRFVLLALADRANDQGGSCYPSILELSKKCAMSQRTVIRAIDGLVDGGFLVRKRHKSRSNSYTIVVDQLRPIESVSDKLSPIVSDNLSHRQVTDCHMVSDNLSPQHVTDCHVTSDNLSPDPSVIHQVIHQGGSTRGAGRSSPPPIVINQPIDRTPGGNGYHPPEEPPVEKRPPSPEVLAVGEMCNAITDVTGISARLNWDVVSGLAGELVDAGYSPEQLRRHYSKQPVPGAWHWYEQDWRGKKGELPSVKAIRETIAGATQVAAAPKKLGQIERALAMFGNAPKPATQGG